MYIFSKKQHAYWFYHIIQRQTATTLMLKTYFVLFCIDGIYVSVMFSFKLNKKKKITFILHYIYSYWSVMHC